MMERWLNQHISLKRDIDAEDYERINELEKICLNNNCINLKLELEYKLNVRKKQSNPLKAINEFLYYADNTLIGYLGVSSFGGNIAEINGMVHPEWRRNGIFTRLYTLAKDECKRRNFNKVLLLCDDRSHSAKGFINSTGSEYDFSEYKMKLEEGNSGMEGRNITLRKAKNYDGEEIARQNSIYFGDPNIALSYPEEEEKNNRITYMIEIEGNTVGKITVEDGEDLSYIYGFGIVPEYRGKGYGREALAATLNIISKRGVSNIFLDVAAENSRALNLYKSCGFVLVTTMNYYEVK